MHGFWLMYTIFICFCTFCIIPIANSSFTGLWGCLSKPVCVCLWVTDSPVSIILYYTDKLCFCLTPLLPLKPLSINISSFYHIGYSSFIKDRLCGWVIGNQLLRASLAAFGWKLGSWAELGRKPKCSNVGFMQLTWCFNCYIKLLPSHFVELITHCHTKFVTLSVVKSFLLFPLDLFLVCWATLVACWILECVTF